MHDLPLTRWHSPAWTIHLTSNAMLFDNFLNGNLSIWSSMKSTKFLCLTSMWLIPKYVIDTKEINISFCLLPHDIFTKEIIIQVPSFCIQSLYSWTKLTQRNERHLIIKLCTYIITLFHKCCAKFTAWYYLCNLKTLLSNKNQAFGEVIELTSPFEKRKEVCLLFFLLENNAV